MSEDKAKSLASEISRLIGEFEDCSPDLHGYLEFIDQSGEDASVDWNLYLDAGIVKIVVETGVNSIFLDSNDLKKMLKAAEFFEQLPAEERKLVMSILERDLDE